MIRLDYLIFGYVVFDINKESIAVVSERFFKAGMSVRFFAGGSFLVKAADKKRVCELLGDVEYSRSEIKGLYGFLLRILRRPGALAAFAACAVMFLLSNMLVWDVRIEGCGEEEANLIISELEDSGLKVGALWNKLDKNEIEARALLSSDSISWININRRGTVAYVKVVKKESHTAEPKPTGYANIVAERDCIIEEITVKSGVAVVKVGESVRAGDVLISGVIPTELGGGYCYAEGSVKGRYSDRVCVFADATVIEKVYSNEKTGGLSLNFFGFSINIFKKYGNSLENCDIIKEKREFTLFSDRLPFSLEYETVKEFAQHKRILSSDEQTELAASMLKERLSEAIGNADLIAVQTDGAFFENGYSMWADVVIRSDVAKVLEFEIGTEQK